MKSPNKKIQLTYQIEIIELSVREWENFANIGELFFNVIYSGNRANNILIGKKQMYVPYILVIY